MVIDKMKSSPSAERFAAIRSAFDAKGAEGMRETQAALALIHGLIERKSAFGDTTALARLESRIDSAVSDSRRQDRKSTRLNSSHQIISYAVFCLKKKKDITLRHFAIHSRLSQTL